MSASTRLAGLKKLAAEGSGATDAERATAKKFIAELEARGVVAEPEYIKPPFADYSKWYPFTPTPAAAPEQSDDARVAFDFLKEILNEFFEHMQNDKRWEQFAREHGVESMSSAPPKKKKKK